MKLMQRRATIAVALALGSLSAPTVLAAQSSRASAPNADTPRLLVAVFASNDKTSGVLAADAIRARVQSGTNVKQLYVIPKTDITNYLESSGYKADSSLGATDLKELAKLLRADEVLSGIVTRTPTGLRIEPRLMLARDVSFAQPLPAVEAGSAGDAARQIEKSLIEARKQLPDNRLCENGIRDQQFDKAIASAKAGILKYPNATIARLCLASAYQQMKAPPDSVLRVTDEIRRLDPKNSFALRLAFTAHGAKGEPEKAVAALIGLLALEPNNPTLQSQVIAELAKLRQPEKALPIIDTLLMQNPGDPQLLKQKWQLTLQAAVNADSTMRPGLLARALAAGEEMVRADTTLADSTYYERQIIAANAMIPPRGLEFASRATQKFPNSATFWALRASAERKAGQLQMAMQSEKRALSIDPKLPNGNLMVAQLYLEMNQADSAVAAARRAVAAGEDPKTWGQFLLGPTQATFKQGQSTDSVVYFERTLALAQESDRLGPTPASKFFVGLASFQIGIDALRQADPLQRQRRPDKARICALGRKSQDMFLLTQTNMPAGGSLDANTARTVLGAVSQYAPAADQIVKQNCK